MISIIALAVVFYIADFERFGDAIRLADYRIIALAIGLTVLWLIVRALAWRTLLREQATFSQVFFTINEGYLLNNVLPFRLGEIGRAFILSRKAQIGFWEVLSSILIERIFDLAFAVSLILISISFIVGAGWALEAALGFGVLVLVGFVLMYMLARNRERAILLFNGLAEKIPFLQRFGRDRVEAFFHGLAVLTDGRRSAKVFAWMVIDWVIGISQYYMLLLAFYNEAEPLWAAFTLGVAALGVAAPSSPGAIGVFELAVVGALAVFGLDPSIALAYAITVHLVQFLVTGFLGAFGFFKDGESLLNIYRRSSQIPQNPN